MKERKPVVECKDVEIRINKEEKTVISKRGLSQGGERVRPLIHSSQRKLKKMMISEFILYKMQNLLNFWLNLFKSI